MNLQTIKFQQFGHCLLNKKLGIKEEKLRPKKYYKRKTFYTCNTFFERKKYYAFTAHSITAQTKIILSVNIFLL